MRVSEGVGEIVRVSEGVVGGDICTKSLTKSLATDHIHDTTWSAHYYLLTIFQFPEIFSHIDPSNASMTLDIKVIT